MIDWLDQHGSYFQTHAPDAWPGLQSDYERLKALHRRPENITVCVLGNSNVGKSTLLNALVAGDRVILPSGGTGPLTASVTEVRYSPQPYLEVAYHSRKTLNGIRAALESELRREQRVPFLQEGKDAEAEGTSSNGEPEPTPDDVPAEDRDLAEQHDQERIGVLKKQARQIVRGDQFAEVDLMTLVAGMRRVLGQTDLDACSLDAADAQRCLRAASALEDGSGGQKVRRTGKVDDPAMMAILRLHAAGSLAPLVESIVVGWPSPLLQDGLILVDLPGVGVTGDRYRAITSDYVRMQARAVLLVVDRAGLKESDVELLRTSGYWERLLLAAGDAEGDKCSVMVAVTKLDDEARTLRHQSIADVRPSVRQCYLDLVETSAPRLKAQAAESLSGLAKAVTAGSNLREAADAANDAMMADLQVLPVLAPQYAYFKRNDEDERPFLQTEEETGIPELSRRLSRLAREHREALDSACVTVAERMKRGVLTALDTIEARWTDDVRATEEVERLRMAFETFLHPLCIRLADSRGHYRGFLEDVHERWISELVEQAKNEATAEMAKYLDRISGLPWATLRAAVVRGGVFLSGRNGPLHIPGDLAALFQEPVSAIWGKKLLRWIRSRTSQHAADLRELVEETCSWAEHEANQGGNRLGLKQLREQAADRESRLREVGAEQIAELRAVVLTQLSAAIAKPIDDACRKFVHDGNSRGKGVKIRIIDLLRALGRDAVRRAQEPTEKLLRGRFEVVRREIIAEFDEWGDPLQRILAAVVDSEESRLARSDLERRVEALAELRPVRASLVATMEPIPAALERCG